MLKATALAALVALNDAVLLECCPDSCDKDQEKDDQILGVAVEVVDQFEEELSNNTAPDIVFDQVEQAMSAVSSDPPTYTAEPEPEVDPIPEEPAVVEEPVVVEPKVWPPEVYLFDSSNCSGDRYTLRLHDDGADHHKGFWDLVAVGWNDRATAVQVTPGHYLEVWQHDGWPAGWKETYHA